MRISQGRADQHASHGAKKSHQSECRTVAENLRERSTGEYATASGSILIWYETSNILASPREALMLRRFGPRTNMRMRERERKTFWFSLQDVRGDDQNGSTDGEAERGLFFFLSATGGEISVSVLKEWEPFMKRQVFNGRSGRE